MLKKLQKFVRQSQVAALALAVLVGMWAHNAHAVEALDDRLEIHGYGHEGYLLTNGNKFLGADSKGTFDYNAMALLFSVKATDDLTIWTQIFGSLNDFRLDWAFVDYKFNNNLSVRGGQIKTPIGIYNEIRDIKYLQLSTIEPLIYQEDLKLAHEAFRGASVVYNQDLPAGRLSLDAYGGQQVDFEEDADLSFRNLVGGRLTYYTPVNGLRVMASGYTSRADMTEDGVTDSGHNNLWMGSVDYHDYGVDLKAEYGRTKLHHINRSGYYVQGGYTFFDKLTPFVRYDYLTTDRSMDDDPSFYQKELTFGVGYKFNSYVAAKLEDHIIRGYAMPVVTGEVAPGAGTKDWNLFAASLNFIF
jgi:hypothetical protein